MCPDCQPQVACLSTGPEDTRGLELQAERRHAFMLDNVYSEASSLEASADEVHHEQLSFIRQSTEVLVGS